MQGKLIVRLMGGLGNQMICYAMGLALARKLGMELIFDSKSGFMHDRYKRSYALDEWGLSLRLARNKDCYLGRRGRIRRRLARSNRVVSGILNTPCFLNLESVIKLLSERIESSEMAMLHQKGVYVEALPRDLDFAKLVRSQLLHDFSNRFSLSDEERGIAEMIRQKNNPVAVHIRRYNEVREAHNVKDASDIVDVKSVEYYLDHIEAMKAKVPDPSFFLFSEEREWVWEHFGVDPSLHIVEFKEKRSENKDAVDIWLMSLCKHFVITQSTFGWWGAWLSQGENKEIYLPDGFKI